MIIGTRNFDTENHCYIMGILNVTPDSFSDGGSYTDVDKALFQVEKMVEEGAHIIDVGGESTRPGYTRISDEEEIERVVPVIEAIKNRIDIPVSVDTYKSQVAEASLKAGVDLINDIWGFRADEKMAKVVADYNAACCLMHNREEAVYKAVSVDMEDNSKEAFHEGVLSDLKESIELAKKAGVQPDKIMIDPGVGFAKTYEMNLDIIKNMDILKVFGYPILLGTSRKSVVGLTLDLPVDERVEGSLVTTVMGVMKGASFVRVHDVKENARAIKMAEAILYI